MNQNEETGNSLADPKAANSAAESAWVQWTTTRADAGLEYITDVKAGYTYEVRARFVNMLGVRGPWSYTSITVDGPSAPAAPTGLTTSIARDDVMTIPRMPTAIAGVFYGAAMLKWNAPAEKNIAHYEVWKTTTGVTNMLARTTGTETRMPIYSAIQINQFTDYLVVKAVSRSGDVSPPSAALEGIDMSFTTNYGPVE